MRRLRISKTYYTLTASLIFLFIYSLALITFATPPGSPYSPGETLDPNCVPGSSNCTVRIIPDQTGNSGKFLTTNGTTTSWAVGGGSPGGGDTQIQFNNSGSFDGSSDFTWDDDSDILTASTTELTLGDVDESATGLRLRIEDTSDFIFLGAGGGYAEGNSFLFGDHANATVSLGIPGTGALWKMSGPDGKVLRYIAGDTWVNFDASNMRFQIGDIDNAHHGQKLFINDLNYSTKLGDFSQETWIETSSMAVPNRINLRVSGIDMLQLQSNGSNIIDAAIGDFNGVGNGTHLFIDDALQYFQFLNGSVGIGGSPTSLLDVISGSDHLLSTSTSSIAMLSGSLRFSRLSNGARYMDFEPGDHVQIGDLDNAETGAKLLLNTTDGIASLLSNATAGNPYLQLDAVSDIVTLFAGTNETRLVLDDANEYFEFINGSVGIGDSTPDYLLDVLLTGTDGDVLALADSDGSCLHNPESGSEVVSCSSDERLKTNITDASPALPYLNDFHIRQYDVIASTDHLTGVIAQEVQTVHPELVTIGADGYFSVASPNTWQIIKAIQELDLRLTPLTSLDVGIEGSLASLVKTYLENAFNNLTKIFVGEVYTDKLCVGETCVTEAELQNLLNTRGTTANGSGGTSGDPVSAGTTGIVEEGGSTGSTGESIEGTTGEDFSGGTSGEATTSEEGTSGESLE